MVLAAEGQALVVATQAATEKGAAFGVHIPQAEAGREVLMVTLEPLVVLAQAAIMAVAMGAVPLVLAVPLVKAVMLVEMVVRQAAEVAQVDKVLVQAQMEQAVTERLEPLEFIHGR